VRYFYQKKRSKTNIEEHEQMIVAAELRRMGVFFTISIAGVNVGPRVGKRLKDAGYRAGTPDIMVFEPRRRWHGLFIEMKRPDVDILDKSKGKVSPSQKEFIGEASKRDYCCHVCYGSDDALTQISHYLTD